jgi:hypothetical protein
VLGSLQDLLVDLPGAISDRVELFALEIKRAMSALGAIVALIIFGAIFCFTAWIALWLGVVAVLMELGLAPGWTLLGVVLVNVLAAWLTLRRIRTLSDLLTLPATMRQLAFGRRPADEDDDASAAQR